MRVDLTQVMAGQVAAEQDAKKVSAQNIAASGLAGEVDRTTLTSDSTSLSGLVGKAMSSPEIRQDKVDSLKQALSTGKYGLDPEKIAASMIDEHA